MGFDDAERSEATQLLDLAEEDSKEDSLIPLRYVKFQNVQSVTVRTDQLKSVLNHTEPHGWAKYIFLLNLISIAWTRVLIYTLE